MGVLKQGVFGGFSGKVGNIIGSSWKGISVIKTKAQSVANPRTAPQVAQRSSFASVMAVATLLLSSMIKQLWDRFAVKMSGINSFVSANIANFDVDGLVDPMLFILSSGKMSTTGAGSVSLSAATGIFNVTWDDDSGEGYKLATDILYVAIYNATTNEWEIGPINVTRATETATANLHNAYTLGDMIYAYMSFRRADGTVVSNSYANGFAAIA